MYIQKWVIISPKTLIFPREINVFGEMVTHFWMYILLSFRWPALYPSFTCTQQSVQSVFTGGSRRSVQSVFLEWVTTISGVVQSVFSDGSQQSVMSFQSVQSVFSSGSSQSVLPVQSVPSNVSQQSVQFRQCSRVGHNSQPIQFQFSQFSQMGHNSHFSPVSFLRPPRCRGVVMSFV